MSAILLLTTIGAQVGSALYNNIRGKKQTVELASLQQKLEEKILLNGIENSREEYMQMCVLQREIEQAMQSDRLELIKRNHLNSIQMEAYNVSLEHWPLFVPPYVIKGQLLDNNALGSSSVDTIPLNCIMTTSMHSKFNQKIFPQLEEGLAHFCSRYWSSLQHNSIRFFQNAWRDKTYGNTVDIGAHIMDLFAHLEDVPTIVLSPAVRNGKITFRFYWWGISNNIQDQHTSEEMVYDPELAITISDDLSLTDEQIKNITNELITKLSAFISYFADMYYWNFYKYTPQLPYIIKTNFVKKLQSDIVDDYVELYANLFNRDNKNQLGAYNSKSISSAIEISRNIKEINGKTNIIDIVSSYLRAHGYHYNTTISLSQNLRSIPFKIDDIWFVKSIYENAFIDISTYEAIIKKLAVGEYVYVSNISELFDTIIHNYGNYGKYIFTVRSGKVCIGFFEHDGVIISSLVAVLDNEINQTNDAYIFDVSDKKCEKGTYLSDIFYLIPNSIFNEEDKVRINKYQKLLKDMKMMASEILVDDSIIEAANYKRLTSKDIADWKKKCDVDTECKIIACFTNDKYYIIQVSMNGDVIVNREISYMFSIDDTLKQLFEKSVILTIKN